MSESLFQQFVIILSFSLLGVLVLRRLRTASIVAYMVVGAIIGPSAIGWIDEPEQFSFLAEFGVVFLLFALGLEFNPRKMLGMRFAVFYVGGFQVLSCTALFYLSVSLWGASPAEALMIAGALALSSTAIVTRELGNNGQIHSVHGQLSIGVLLFQDLVAVVFLVLVPVLGCGEDTAIGPALAEAGINAAIVVSILLAVGYWLLPHIYKEVAKSQSSEIFLLTTLVIVMLAAWLTHAFHLSMTLGAFVIGMMLGEGPMKYQIESDIRPFRDILLGLFFVTIGMSINLELLLEFWPRLLMFTAILILVKFLAVSAVVKILGHSGRDALTVGFDLAQAGEFGLALLALALSNGVVPADQASFITLIAIFSMMLSPVLIRHGTALGQRLLPGSGSETEVPGLPAKMNNHVIIAGYGRLGSLLAEFLESNGISYVAIDFNIDLVHSARKQGKPVVYGDNNDLDLLQHCHLAEARLIVLTFKSLSEGKRAINRIRSFHKDIPIIVRCQEHSHYEELISLGANRVIPEVLESSLIITRQMLQLLDIREDEVDQQVADYLGSLKIKGLE